MLSQFCQLDPDSEGKIKADLDPGIKMNADPNPKM